MKASKFKRGYAREAFYLHFYTRHINPCLIELQQHRLGFCIGTTYCSCPTCADDLAFLSNCENELQIMMNVARRNAIQDRVTIHPDKSNAVLLNSHKSISKKSFSLDMEDKTIQLSSSTTHLGLFRSEVNENVLNIEERLSLARRTLYSLINTGVHGSNGLNPKVSYKIYQSYVVPRLLYGLEVLPLNNTQMNILSKFHLDNLKKFQSLPIRVATCAVYLLEVRCTSVRSRNPQKTAKFVVQHTRIYERNSKRLIR